MVDHVIKTLKAGSVISSYTYNNQNLVESESVVIPGRNGALKVDYHYNSNLHLRGITYPGGNRVVNLTPNAFGEPTNINRSGRTFASNIDFYPHGVIKQFTYGNSVTHNTTLFGQSNLPSRMADMKGTTRLAWFDYTYDDNANIKSILDGTDSGYNLTNLTYDGLDRLKSTTGGSKAGSTSISYDALGNITRLDTLNRSLIYSIDSNQNRLKSVSSSGSKAKAYGYFNYDTRGNIIHNSHFSMSYNLANQMTAANGFSFTYDGFNRRVKSAKSGSTAYYHYSQDGKLLFSESNGVWKNYIYIGSRLIAKDSSSSTSFIHTDILGSTTAQSNSSGTLINNSRRHYKPFGDTYETASNEIGYAGHKFDSELGLSYMQARYYDPVIGRFYSNDPVDAVSHLSNEEGSKGFNRYSYAVNNPYKYTDPDGREVKVVARPLRTTALGGLGAHTYTVVTQSNGTQTTFSSHNVNGQNVVSMNHSSDTSPHMNAGSVVISPPEGMTQEQFDSAVIAQGEAMVNSESLEYSAFPNSDNSGEGNCHTTTRNLVNGAGGKIPESYDPKGMNPDLQGDRKTDVDQ